MELADEADAGFAVDSAAPPPSLEVSASLEEPDRGPRPAVPAGLPIADYSKAELEGLGPVVETRTPCFVPMMSFW